MDIALLYSLVKSPLNYAEQIIVNDMVLGKRPIVFGDPEETAIIKKLNETERIKQDMLVNKSETKKLIKVEINSIQMEIDDLYSEIRSKENDKSSFEKLLKDIENM